MSAWGFALAARAWPIGLLPMLRAESAHPLRLLQPRAGCAPGRRRAENRAAPPPLPRPTPTRWASGWWATCPFTWAGRARTCGPTATCLSWTRPPASRQRWGRRGRGWGARGGGLAAGPAAAPASAPFADGRAGRACQWARAFLCASPPAAPAAPTAPTAPTGPPLRARQVSGVPPDAFSETGQLWGSPLYRWPAHEAEGYAWWAARLARAFSLYDETRIDHFRWGRGTGGDLRGGLSCLPRRRRSAAQPAHVCFVQAVLTRRRAVRRLRCSVAVCRACAAWAAPATAPLPSPPVPPRRSAFAGYWSVPAGEETAMNGSWWARARARGPAPPQAAAAFARHAHRRQRLLGGSN